MDWFLAVFHNWFGTLTARTAIRAAWCVTGCLTSILFFATNAPLPRRAVWRNDEPDKPELGSTECLRDCIAPYQCPLLRDEDGEPTKPHTFVTMFLGIGKLIFANNTILGGAIASIWIDQVHHLLALETRPPHQIHLYSWPACSSLGVSLDTGSWCQLAFSRDGRRILTMSEAGIKEWNASTGRELNCWEQHPHRIRDEAWTSPRLHYDQQNHPKLIRVTDGQVERWDLHSERRDFYLKPDCSIYDGDKESWIFDLDIERDLLACVLNDNEMGVWSLDKGKLTRSFRRPAGLDDLRFSPDGRFLAYRCGRELSGYLQSFIGELFPNLERLCNQTRFSTGIIGLRDPYLGATWSFPNTSYCDFADNCLRVYYYNAGGLGFEYDVPPRWRLFTPWAWLSLAIWIGLTWCCWKLPRANSGSRISRRLPSETAPKPCRSIN
jgi:hypothetical protein